MVEKSTKIKNLNQLNNAINQLCKNFWLFSERPGKDFTRTRKLPVRKMISFMLAMEGGALATEILQYFGYSADIASSSAFVQQRAKIHSEVFQSLCDAIRFWLGVTIAVKRKSNQNYDHLKRAKRE